MVARLANRQKPPTSLALVTEGHTSLMVLECKAGSAAGWYEDLFSMDNRRTWPAELKAAGALRQCWDYSDGLQQTEAMLPSLHRWHGFPTEAHGVVDLGGKAIHQSAPLVALNPIGWSADTHRRETPRSPPSAAMLDFSPPPDNAELADGLKPVATFVHMCLEHARLAWASSDGENFLRNEAVHAFLSNVHLLDEMYHDVTFSVSAENAAGGGRFDLLIWARFRDHVV